LTQSAVAFHAIKSPTAYYLPNKLADYLASSTESETYTPKLKGEFKAKEKMA